MSARGVSPFPVVLVVLLLATLSNLPFLRASALPPSGRAFVGVFYSIPDVYNYFSYMQQAEAGAFLFENKLSLEPHRPALVNLEWWAVGRLAGLTGMSVVAAFQVLGLLAMLALVVGADRWLVRAGLPGTHRLGALLLIFFGAGFGGLFFLAKGPPAWRFLDLTTGLFPIISVMVNAHFVTGTALLVWATLLLNRGGWCVPAGLLLGNLLGLSRPYDVVLLVAIQALTVLVLEPLTRAPRRLLPLVGLLPAVLINYWTLYASPAFRMLSSFHYSVPPYLSLALALGPALGLAAWGVREAAKGGQGGQDERLHRTSLLSWAAAALVSMGALSIPFSFLSQAGVNIGVPLFGLAALGLTKRPARVLVVVALLASTTGLVALKLLLEDNPSWFVPRVRLEAARVLRPLCRPGNVALAPPDIGLYLNAWSSCRAFVTHVVAPDTELRRAELEFFYRKARPDERRALLDRRCVTHVVLPARAEGAQEQGLGPDFRLAARVVAGDVLDIFVRELPAGCAPPAGP